ncbi:hypothetical protein [Ruegeria atlantica]|uniref:hypothetical protein n=1 Tax=Ruegeria atlantica TaxID=81569 RepID=UPI00147A134B|nr:hypothetical protein [Ruegeria atlantica]
MTFGIPKTLIPPNKPTRAERMESIAHPHWSSMDDFCLLQARRQSQSFSQIADDLGRTRAAVEVRFHRLRIVPDIEQLLEDYGLSETPYETARGEKGRSLSDPLKFEKERPSDIRRPSP